MANVERTGTVPPGAIVSVFDAGTTTLSTIFSDIGGTPQENPFAADPVTGAYSYFIDETQPSYVAAGVQGTTGTPRLRQAVLTGGAAGDFTISGITLADTLIGVTRFIGAGVAVTDVTDLTAEFTITAENTINNGGGTNTTGSKLLVLWLDAA